jgi:hypothetical protein
VLIREKAADRAHEGLERPPAQVLPAQVRVVGDPEVREHRVDRRARPQLEDLAVAEHVAQAQRKSVLLHLAQRHPRLDEQVHPVRLVVAGRRYA